METKNIQIIPPEGDYGTILHPETNAKQVRMEGSDVKTILNSHFAENATGTFTPVITIGGSGSGITYNKQLGKFTKIGNIVVVDINLYLTSKGSNQGNVSIEGLPFPINTPYGVYLDFIIGRTISPDATKPMRGWLENGKTIIDLYLVNLAGAATRVKESNIDDKLTIYASITYQI